MEKLLHEQVPNTNINYFGTNIRHIPFSGRINKVLNLALSNFQIAFFEETKFIKMRQMGHSTRPFGTLSVSSGNKIHEFFM
jgi:hypothetical protein